VILVDVNLLIYAYIVESAHHPAAKRWFDARLSGQDRVGLPWASLLGFVRIVSNPRIAVNPPSIVQAWAQVDAWLDAPPVWVPTPGERHREVLASLIPTVTSFNLVPDAHLAALAIEHGLVLATNDRGFARFPRLRWQNPLLPN
jgi:uncharacterized protein